ncbi:ribonuclease H-like domain-containing protein [bacterium]|nr:ribonuclease H-like domain-containing protein [bacterium]
MPSLKGRISRLKSLGLVKASEIGAGEPAAPGVPASAESSSPAPGAPPALSRRGKASPPERGRFLPGWDRISPYLYVRTVSANFSLGEAQAPFFHPAHFERHFLPPSFEAPRAPEVCVPLEGLSFFDLETTGLSGGTGTIAFLAAVGYFDGAEFLVTQAFIDDFPGEPGFLEYVSGLLARRPHVVTYNGAAFDLPLLRTRCIMNAVAVPELAHTDVLKAARRLWRKTLGNCSLQAMEGAVLGEERVGDIPGFLIPGLWLEYSASGAGGADTLESMGRIAQHNAMDVGSLARLLLRVERIMLEPERRWAADRVFAPRLASELMALGRDDEGLSVLEASGAEGDQDALLLLARIRRRRREFDAYGRAVFAMDGDSLLGLVERAKVLEHLRRDYRGALECAERASGILCGGGGTRNGVKSSRRYEALEGLERRRERLAKKIARVEGEGASPS